MQFFKLQCKMCVYICLSKSVFALLRIISSFDLIRLLIKKEKMFLTTFNFNYICLNSPCFHSKFLIFFLNSFRFIFFVWFFFKTITIMQIFNDRKFCKIIMRKKMLNIIKMYINNISGEEKGYDMINSIHRLSQLKK